MWIDHFGTLAVRNIKTKDTCNITFEKCGWLGKGRYELSGHVKDSKGNST